MPLVFLYNWRELLSIAYHQKLHSAERLVVASVAAQSHIHCIKQVGPDHRDLVYNEEVKGTDDLHPILSEAAKTLRCLILGKKFLYIWKIWAQRELKE